MIPKTEIGQQPSDELVMTKREIPTRRNNTSMPFGPQVYQRLTENNEEDKGIDIAENIWFSN